MTNEISNRLFKFEQRILALEEAQAVLKNKVFTIEFVAEARHKYRKWWEFWK